jgi:hypothetical protein
MSDRDPQLDQVVSWRVSPWRTVDTCVMTPATKTSRFSMSALRLGPVTIACALGKPL